MSSQFSVYFRLGLDHISDLSAYDHILFLVALCAIYQLREFKKILVLVTAFTIGHSVTLALSALDIVVVNGDLIEFLIPVTILLTAMANIWSPEAQTNSKLLSRKLQFNYGMALFFGFIHGMGFSNYFKSLLGSSDQIVAPLFYFNVGVEVGQLIIVTCIMAISYVFLRILNVKIRDWVIFVSGVAAGLAFVMMLETNYL
jgi:hypothetical protein